MTARLIAELHAESAGPAAQALEAGRWDEAAAHLSRARPDSAAGHALRLTEAVLRAQTRLGEGNTEAAFSDYRTALSIAPDFYRLQNLTGNLFLDVGNYPEAERYYCAAVRLNPDYAAGHCNIGAVRLAQGNISDALPALTQATRLDPTFGYAWRVTADAHLAQGDTQAAIHALMKAAACSPEDPEPCIMLGELRDQQGEHAEALSYYRQAIARGLENPDFLRHIGERLLMAGQIDMAMPLAQRAVQAEPSAASGWLLLGNVHHALGGFADAASAFKHAIRFAPDLAEAHCNLGNTLCELREFSQAETALAEAIRVNPLLPEAYNNMATALAGMHRHQEALEYCNQALSLSGDFLGARLNRGRTLQLLHNHLAANSDYLFVLGQQPDNPTALSDYAGCLNAQQRYEEAENKCRKALTHYPSHYEATHHLGYALDKLDKLDEALFVCKRAVEIGPEKSESWINLGNAYLRLEMLDDAIKVMHETVTRFPENNHAWCNLNFSQSISPAVNPEQYLRSAMQTEKVFSKNIGVYPGSPQLLTEERAFLNIGLVSGDFRNHPVGYFLESIIYHLKTHNIYAYNNFPGAGDSLTARIKPYFHAWCDISALEDMAVANRIIADKIDILIDLSGYTAYNRLPIFIWRLAPVQITWLGFFASTGISQFDWLLTDPVSSPPGSENHFVESLWRLPFTRLCFSPPEPTICGEVAASPALKNGHITFGCFQRLSKITPAMIETWSNVLRLLPNSKLKLKGSGLNTESGKKKLLTLFRSHGILNNRLILEGPSTRADYFNAYATVDIMLDTFPFPGGTTTCDALWMGVPTLTLAGGTLLQRQGASLITAAGLPEWIASSKEEFIRKAIHFGSDTSCLSNLRQSLRQSMMSSPLMDARRFARQLESDWFSMRRQASPRKNSGQP